MLIGGTNLVSNHQGLMRQVTNKNTQVNEVNNAKQNHITETTTGISIDISEEAQALYQQKQQEIAALKEQLKAQKESGDAEAEAIKEQLKIFIIAARLANGDRVPPSDEKKLMEFDSDLYMVSKWAGEQERSKGKKVKEYDSVYDEEKEGNTDEVSSEVDDTPGYEVSQSTEAVVIKTPEAQ